MAEKDLKDGQQNAKFVAGADTTKPAQPASAEQSEQQEEVNLLDTPEYQRYLIGTNDKGISLYIMPTEIGAEHRRDYQFWDRVTDESANPIVIDFREKEDEVNLDQLNEIIDALLVSYKYVVPGCSRVVQLMDEDLIDHDLPTLFNNLDSRTGGFIMHQFSAPSCIPYDSIGRNTSLIMTVSPEILERNNQLILSQIFTLAVMAFRDPSQEHKFDNPRTGEETRILCDRAISIINSGKFDSLIRQYNDAILLQYNSEMSDKQIEEARGQVASAIKNAVPLLHSMIETFQKVIDNVEAYKSDGGEK